MTEKINEYIAPYHWSYVGFHKNFYEWPVRRIITSLKKTDKVLDVGCGDGKLTSLMAPHVASITAVDNQKIALQFAKLITDQAQIKNIKWKQDDARNIKEADESFDVVTCFDMVEHVPQETAKKVIRELTRILKKGGKLILTTPNRDELRGRIFGHKVIDKHYYEYNYKELEDMFKENFKDLKIEGYYIPIPLPRAEHVCNVLPFRLVFNWLIGKGKKHPKLSVGLLVTGTKK